MALKLVRSVVFSALAMEGSVRSGSVGSGSLPMLRLVSATVGPLLDRSRLERIKPDCGSV